jgi:hypothetical protein
MQAQVDTAHVLHLRPIVLVTSPSWCEGCQLLEHELKAPGLVHALRHIYVIKLDPDDRGAQFIQYGFYRPKWHFVGSMPSQPRDTGATAARPEPTVLSRTQSAELLRP